MFNALLYEYSINKIVKKIYRCIIKRCWVLVVFILFILEGGKLRSHVCEGGDLSAKRGGMPKCGCSTGIFEGNKIK